MEATGLLKGFSVNGAGWTVVDVEGAPRGIATKRQPVVDAVKELVGQQVTIGYTETDAEKINPNTGSPYKNRLLNSIVPVRQPASNDANPPGPPPQSAPQAPAAPAAGPVAVERDASIIRQVAWKAAAAMSPGGSFADARALARKIFVDITEGDWSDDEIPF